MLPNYATQQLVSASDVRGSGRVVEVPLAEAYLIWSIEKEAWWGPAFCGYYVSPFCAGVYTRAAAEAEAMPPRGYAATEKPRRLLEVLERATADEAARPSVADLIRTALAEPSVMTVPRAHGGDESATAEDAHRALAVIYEMTDPANVPQAINAREIELMRRALDADRSARPHLQAAS